MPITEQEVEFTLHAVEKIQERGISTTEVLRTLQQGAKSKQLEGILTVHAGIGVAYRKTAKGTYRVKTVMRI